jgi:hypothetical protein
MPLSPRLSRRLASALVATAVATVSLAPLAAVAQAPASAAARQTPSDNWLKGIKGTHRQLFDSPAPAGGIQLVHILNYYETLNKAYGVKDAQINAVGTFYGTTTFYGLNDAMWAKYRIGEFLETNDPSTGKPAVANPWRANPVVIGLTLPQASIESLQKRGATFILCNNALTIFSGVLAKARGLDADSVYNDLASNILPGVNLIPGMVVAIEQAHTANMSYHRQ